MSLARAETVVELSEEGKMSQEQSVCVIDLPKIVDHRGNLTFIEGNRHVPFPIRRTYYLYDVPAGATRGGHAHKVTEEFVIAASGSFTVVADDGRKRRKFFLNRPHYGLYIPRMIWRELENFSSGSICLVVSSEEYNESDYYRDYKDFKLALRKERASVISGATLDLPGTQRGNGHRGGSRSR